MKTQRNELLSSIGIPKRDYGINFIAADKKSAKKYEKQIKKDISKYGFSSIECWNLNTTFLEWLYSHLKLYMKTAEHMIDFDFHKFEFEGVTYTQREAMNYILERLEFGLKNRSVIGMSLEEQLKMDKDNQDAIRMWALIFEYCWW